MEEDFPESSLNDELQSSRTEVIQDSLQDLILDQSLQDQQNQSPEGLKLDQEQQSPHSGQDQVQLPDEESTQDEVEHHKCGPDPPQDQLEEVDQSPAGASGQESDVSQDHQTVHVEDPDLLGAEQNQDPGQRVDLDRVLIQDQDRQGHTGSDQDQDQNQDQDQDLTTAAANREASGESGGGVPALVITQAVEECLVPGSAALGGPAGTPVEPAEPRRPQRPTDLMILLTSTEPSLSSSSEGADMSCSDLLSLRSDSLSLASEPTISRTSEDEDSRSVAASSVMSLFHRVQLDPLEKDWLRSSALGNMAAQRQLLSQESSLVLKKTALHWAAKQGRQEAVDMMICSGAEVNVRSGYTALHLASIHGHQHVVHALINTYNAKTNIRDYHGKTAAHYWSGCTDVFNKPQTPTGGRFHRGRQTQRYVLPSLLLSRSRSQGQFSLEFRTVPQSASHDVLDLQV